MKEISEFIGDGEKDESYEDDVDENISKEEIKRYWESLSYLIVTVFALEALGTPSLRLPLQEEISDTSNDSKLRLLCTFLYSDLGLEGFVEKLEKISKEFIKDDLYSDTLLAKLNYYHSFSKLSKPQLNKLETVIARLLASKDGNTRYRGAQGADLIPLKKAGIQRQRLKKKLSDKDDLLL